MQILDWIILTIYFLVIASLGWVKKVKHESMRDYAVASAGVGTFAAFASLTGSYIGPGYTLGLAEKGFQFGIVYLIVFLGFSLQTFLVGFFLAPKLHSYSSAYSVGDVIGQHYGKTAQILTGFLSFLYCAGIVGVVANAGGSIFSAMTGVDSWVGICLLTIVVLIYTVRGGIKAVIGTDFLQFLILIIGVPTVLFGAWNMLSQASDVTPLPETHLTFFGALSPLTVFGLFLGFLLGETLVPPYAARCLITKKASHTKFAFILSALFSVFWFAMIIGIGLIGRQVMPDANGADIFMLLSFKCLSTGILGLVVVAIISIIMSTQDSFLNAAAVSFTRDLWITFRKRNGDVEKHQVMISKIITLAVAILGIIFAISIPGLIEGILIVYTLWAPTVIIPLIGGLLFKIKHPYAGTAAIVAGGVTAALWEWIFSVPFGVPSLIPGISANLITYIVALKINPTPFNISESTNENSE